MNGTAKSTTIFWDRSDPGDQWLLTALGDFRSHKRGKRLKQLALIGLASELAGQPMVVGTVATLPRQVADPVPKAQEASAIDPGAPLSEPTPDPAAGGESQMSATAAGRIMSFMQDMDIDLDLS